jgi:hypothetical protein
VRDSALFAGVFAGAVAGVLFSLVFIATLFVGVLFAGVFFAGAFLATASGDLAALLAAAVRVGADFFFVADVVIERLPPAFVGDWSGLIAGR